MGADPQNLPILYKGVIRPTIEYMAPLLLDCTAAESLMLQRIQFKAIRISLGAMISTHTLALEQEANIMPLPQRFLLLANCLINKLISRRNHPATTYILKFIENYNETPTFIKEYYNKMHEFNIEMNDGSPRHQYPFETVILKPNVNFMEIKKDEMSSEQINRLYGDLIAGRWRSFTRIYTDGAKNPQKTSCAFWAPDMDIEASFSLRPSCSIYTAEAYAIIESLMFIRVNDCGRYLIISDSKSVLTALDSFGSNRTHSYIWKIKHILHELEVSEYTIHFLWIPSHSGIEDNEHVDTLAVNHNDAPDYPPIPHYDVKAHDRDRMISLWKGKWEESPYGRRLYSLSRTVNTTPWFKDRKLPRNVITLICRLRFGHVLTGEHLTRINILHSNLCSCGSAQTINHLIFECPNMNHNNRGTLMDKLHETGIRRLDVMEILRKDQNAIFFALHKFFHHSKTIL